MDKTITITGQVAVILEGDGRMTNLQFLPDDENALVFEQSCLSIGTLQLMRNGSFDFVSEETSKVNSNFNNK